MVYVCLEKDEISGTKGKVLNENAIKEDPNQEQSKNRLLYHNENEEFLIGEVNEDGSLYIYAEPSLGFISGEVKLTEENIIDLLEIFVKKLNKLKTAMESLK